MKIHKTFTSFLLIAAVFHCITRATADESNGQHFTDTMPSQLDYARLDNNMTGRLVFPEPPSDYSKFNFQWNHRTKTFPLTHAVVKSVEDIREAVLFARNHNLRVTVKSSGHDFLGRSSAYNSFCVNLMEMKSMTVTPDRTPRSEHGEIKVETGATWVEIYQEVHKYDRVVVGGSAHKVTPGGYTLGGGHSPLSPSLGLAIDNLLEIQVVLADGRISTCTDNKTTHLYPDGRKETENNRDLFWALRGGGGGTYGIVAYYVFKLHPAPTSMVKVIVQCAFYVNTTDMLLARRVLNEYNEWVKNAPSHWGGYFIFNNLPVHIPASQETQYTTWDLTGTFTIVLNKFGPWDENTQNELGFLYRLKLTYGDYLTPFLIENKTSFWDYEKDVYDVEQGRIYTLGSLIPKESHNEALTDFFLDEFLYKNDGGIPKSCTVARLGGKVNDYSVTSSSVSPGFRSAQVWAACGIPVSEWNDFSLATFERQARYKYEAEGFAERLKKFGNGEYLNEGDDFSPTWKRDFWGEHYDRLLKIKMKYDPDNVFTCHHCVGSDIQETSTVTTPVDSCKPVSGAVTSETSYVTVVLMIIATVFF